jgi:hypothetical protein
MLTDLGAPFLRWLDDVVLLEAYVQLDRFQAYVTRWRETLGA